MRHGMMLAVLLLATGPLAAQTSDDYTEPLSADGLAAVLDGPTSHEVRSGDTLSGLAGRYYGDMALWPAVWYANIDLLGDDPASITPGMELTMPSLDEAIAYDGGAPSATPLQIERRSETLAESAEVGGAIPDWMYFEGIARAIRREYLTFENAGRIAFVDPALKEGDFVQAGHVIAYQDQRRPTAQVETAEAQIVGARTELAVSEATLMEAQANLLLAERTFERFAVLLRQNSASQQEYDEAEAQLKAARAAALRAERQIDAARAQIGVGEANRATATVARDESYLIAPMNGLIARHNIEQGDYYTPQYIQTQSEQALFNTVPVILIDPSRYEITINVSSDRFDAVTVGSTALIEIVDQDASLAERLPDEAEGPPKPAEAYAIEGVIYSVSPVFDTDLRNFKVTVHTVRGQENLNDGETVSLWIKNTAR